MTESQFNQLLESQRRIEDAILSLHKDLQELSGRVVALETRNMIADQLGVGTSSLGQKAKEATGPLGLAAGLAALIKAWFLSGGGH